MSTTGGGNGAPMSDLEGKNVLVTGASKNIGRAVAEAFAEVGADVGITALSDEEGCAETARRVEALGSEAAVALGDLAEPDDIEAMASEIRSTLGPIDVLVNNAAIRPAKPFLETTVEEWDRVHGVNLRGAFLMAQQAVPDMLEAGSGAVINVLGLMALKGRNGEVHVGASKTGGIGLTLSLAAEFGEEDIRVNGVVPGRKITTGEGDTERSLRNIEQATPLRRRGEPEEVATVTRFLASEEASFVTGQIVQADGGLHPVAEVEAIR